MRKSFLLVDGIDSPERWLPVVGFEENYEVSNQGRVRSLPRIDKSGHSRGGHMMKLRECPVHGYMTVKLTKDGKAKLCKVHRLVLDAFRGPKPGMSSLHGNDVRYHNYLSNLRWGTVQENKQDAQRNNRIARGERNGGGGKLKDEQVKEIRNLSRQGYGRSVLADRYGVSSAVISAIALGKIWKHVA